MDIPHYIAITQIPHHNPKNKEDMSWVIKGFNYPDSLKKHVQFLKLQKIECISIDLEKLLNSDSSKDFDIGIILMGLLDNYNLRKKHEFISLENCEGRAKVIQDLIEFLLPPEKQEAFSSSLKELTSQIH